MSSDNESINFYVIAKKDSEELVTSVLEGGPDGKGDVLAVFTQQSAAEVYLNQAGWVETETTAELEPAAFLEWLLAATEAGPTLIAVNPDRVHQDDEIRQTVIPVRELFNRLGPAIKQCLTSTEVAST